MQEKTILSKETVYDKLFAKVNAIDTSRFVIKAQYSTDKSDLEKKLMILTKNTWY